MLEAPLHEKGKIADPVKQLRHRSNGCARFGISERDSARARARERERESEGGEGEMYHNTHRCWFLFFLSFLYFYVGSSV